MSTIPYSPMIEVHFGSLGSSQSAKHFSGEGPFVVGEVIRTQSRDTAPLSDFTIRDCFVALKGRSKTWVLVVDALDAANQ